MFRSLFSVRRGLAAGGAVLLLGASAVGVAMAQSTPTPATAQNGSSAYRTFLDALAKRLNISTTSLQSAITQARSDAGLPPNGGFGPGPGRGGPGGPRGGLDLSVAATTIGISQDQLRQELATKSLADVATGHGKNPSDVATALKNAVHTRIDQAVTDGHIPAAQATQDKAQADQRIDQEMTQVRTQHGPPPPPPAGEGGQEVLQ